MLTQWAGLFWGWGWGRGRGACCQLVSLVMCIWESIGAVAKAQSVSLCGHKAYK